MKNEEHQKRRTEAEFIIENKLDAERLKRIIRNTSIVSWKKEITEEKIKEWLSNFNGSFFGKIENERKLALWLLAHYTYYSMEDVKILCKVLFDKFLHVKLKETNNINLEEAISDIIDNTLFVGLGNDSESGNNILYYFRQENNLKKDCFEININKKYKNVVYIDDVTISGEQALEYINSRQLKTNDIYVATLIAAEEAVTRLQTSSSIKIKPISTMILDKRDQAFSQCSFVFSDRDIAKTKQVVLDFCRFYGERAVKGWGYMERYPLGFKNGQYMFGFEYNTPDNTLPIFWGTGDGWKLLFKRYPKIFAGRERVSDDRKYF